ncbi:hypothetical protein TIFTF001_027104 [Ficus carica]|uniref:NLP1-9 GAF domain-containing protein n=1 Tax=Ficus carica TaxID=3494 RepID=A0AA88DMJ1_FICCA|nr:hypothetical protein TIFTF001_027104 [Ficus carica]
MDLNQQRLPDEDYQEFKDEISEVLKSVDKMHELSLLRAWVPCFLNHTCVDGQLGHVNSVSILEGVFEKARYRESGLFHFKLVSSSFHLLKGQGVIGKAFMTNHPFFSTDITSSSNADDPLSSCAWLNGVHKAAVAIPLRSIRNADCILEFLFPTRCRNLEEPMKILAALFLTLKQCCKTLSVVTENVLVEKSNSPFPTFQLLQPFNPVEQNRPYDSFPKENPREADPKCVMQLLPLSNAQNKNYSDPTSTIEPAEVCDALIGQGSMAVYETSEERHATREKTIHTHDTSLNDVAKCTGGFQGLFEHSKSKGMHLFQQRLLDKDYQEFKDEISEVLKSVFKLHGLPLARAWVPCVLNQTCVDGQLNHKSSVSILESMLAKSISWHTILLSKHSFLSNPEDPVSSCAEAYGISTAAVAIPLRSIHSADCILEFLLPLDCKNLEEQMKMLTTLFSTLKQSFEQSDSLFQKENPREADPKRMMQLLPGSSARNEDCLEPTLSIEPTKPCDGNGQDRFSSWVSRERIEVEHDWLFQMENPREALDGKLLRESSDQNEKCQDPTLPSVEPAEVCDTVGLGILAVSETKVEKHMPQERKLST